MALQRIPRGHRPVSYTHLDVYKRQAAKAATGTVISRPAQKSATSSRSAAAAAPAKAAPTAQKQSGFRSLAKLPETVKRTAAPTVAAAQQRASDRSRLQENMLAWHGADTAGRRALEQENAAIRGRLGLAYNCLLYTSRCV